MLWNYNRGTWKSREIDPFYFKKRKKQNKQDTENYFGSKNKDEQQKRNWTPMTNIQMFFTFIACVRPTQTALFIVAMGNSAFSFEMEQLTAYDFRNSQVHSILFISNTTALGHNKHTIACRHSDIFYLKEKIVELWNMKAIECVSLLWSK